MYGNGWTDPNYPLIPAEPYGRDINVITMEFRTLYLMLTIRSSEVYLLDCWKGNGTLRKRFYMSSKRNRSNRLDLRPSYQNIPNRHYIITLDLLSPIRFFTVCIWCHWYNPLMRMRWMLIWTNCIDHHPEVWFSPPSCYFVIVQTYSWKT